MGILKRGLETLGHGSTIWTFLPTAWQGVVTTGLTAVTGYFGYLTGGMFYALVGGAIVFACCCAAIYFIVRLSIFMGVFERVSITAVGIQDIGLKEDPNRLTHITMFFLLKNDSQRLVFYRLRRAHNELAGKVHPSAGVDRSILILQTAAEVPVTLPTLEDFALPEESGIGAPEGRLEVEIEYGPSRDDLCYLIRYVGATALGISYNKGAKKGKFAMGARVLELIHQRLG
jgi:hypothetical protein